MNHRTKTWLFSGSAALFAALLVGCAHDKPMPPTEPAPAAEAAPQAALAAEKPGVAEGELMIVTAKVKAIDQKKRTVTLEYPDGKRAKIKCGPEVRNFPQIRVGDDVTAEFLETVELFVAGPGDKPAPGETTAVKRAPEGGKPGIAAIQSVEVAATVTAIDYPGRTVTLQGPEGKLLKVKAGPEVKRFDQIKQGDSVIARYTEAFSIKVAAPQAK
jgi:hypothetical protein